VSRGGGVGWEGSFFMEIYIGKYVGFPEEEAVTLPDLKKTYI
jgi:hypothetical protein